MRAETLDLIERLIIHRVVRLHELDAAVDVDQRGLEQPDMGQAFGQRLIAFRRQHGIEFVGQRDVKLANRLLQKLIAVLRAGPRDFPHALLERGHQAGDVLTHNSSFPPLLAIEKPRRIQQRHRPPAATRP